MSRRPQAKRGNFPRSLRWLAWPMALLVVAIPVWWMVSSTGRKSPAHARPTPGAEAVPDQAQTFAAYAGSSGCQNCHQEEFSAWGHSHHGLAERRLSDALDSPAFSLTRTFTHGSTQTTAHLDQDRFELLTQGLYGTDQVFRVERVLGEKPLRQFLVEFPSGRLQASEAAWDPRSNEWFDVFGQEDRKPGEWGHWTGRGMNWNSMCALCHNTRLRKNYRPAIDTYQTSFVETGVGCEACHGPLKEHGQWQATHRPARSSDPTVHPLTREQMFDTCGGCHSRRAELTGDPEPGDSFWDQFALSVVDDSSLFYPDGQVHEEDYELAPFLGSRMHHQGVRCVDCHEPHTLQTRLPGNLLCLSCHSPGMTNAPAINPVTHSHHEVFGCDTNGNVVEWNVASYQAPGIAQTGGQCVNCHMPQTTYMQRHRRHDHGFTNPDPLLSKEFGIPNACNRCHADQTVDWSLEHVEKWYGDKMDRAYRRRAQLLARVRSGDHGALDAALQLLKAEDNYYWRAVEVGLLGRWAEEPQVTSALSGRLRDAHPLVRQMAIRALGPLLEMGHTNLAGVLDARLSDPSRSVRLEAARELAATLDTDALAGAEYVRFLDHVADQPTGQLEAGLFALARGDPTNALAHLRKAVTWDPFSAGLRHELAIVLSRLDRPSEATHELEEAVRLAPNDAELHYSLALALNELGQSQSVLSELERAVGLDPRRARAWYNLGLERSAAGDDPGALEALVRAESLTGSDPRIPYARATILARLGRIDEARTAAQRALELEPAFADAAALLRQLADR